MSPYEPGESARGGSPRRTTTSGPPQVTSGRGQKGSSSGRDGVLTEPRTTTLRPGAKRFAATSNSEEPFDVPRSSPATVVPSARTTLRPSRTFPPGSLAPRSPATDDALPTRASVAATKAHEAESAAAAWLRPRERANPSARNVRE